MKPAQIAAGACSAPRGGKIKFSHLQYDAAVYDRQGGAGSVTQTGYNWNYASGATNETRNF